MRLGCRSIRAGWPRRWAGGLVAALLITVFLGDLPEVHGHDAPGFYDEDCPLARLAAAGPRVPLPQPPDVLLPAPAVHPVPAPPVVAVAAVPRVSFDPRAPPAQTPRSILG
jgi:hypothetical protein